MFSFLPYFHCLVSSCTYPLSLEGALTSTVDSLESSPKPGLLLAVLGT